MIIDFLAEIKSEYKIVLMKQNYSNSTYTLAEELS